MVVILLAAAIGVALPIFLIEARRQSAGIAAAAMLPAVILIAIGVTLSRLTITVDDDAVHWAFGLGIARGSIGLADIDSVSIVKNPWYYGLGVRLTPIGMLYRVSGGAAVALHGARHTIQLGSDEPQALLAAIQAAQGRLQRTG